MNMKSYLLIALCGLAIGATVHGAPGDPCPCPQCIIYDPICAYTWDREYRVFSSECHMRCYNRCYSTNFMKRNKGSKC
ncbi:locustin [Anabrus simplex]|uniref:locustin n=1 Tax=Anabrus simplex TaxID=316456 RepID=UPI0035A3D3FD